MWYDDIYKAYSHKFMLAGVAFIICVVVMSFCGCESVTEPENDIKSSLYFLPYYIHYDHDAQFTTEDKINTDGTIKYVVFSVKNFADTVFFNFFITVNNKDTLYLSPKLSTEAIEKETFYISKKFNGILNVHMFRYETFKPIDFECEIFYQ